MILEGTTDLVKVTDTVYEKNQNRGQLSFFPTPMQELESKILDAFQGDGVVDIPKLCEKQPRLGLVRDIARQNHFMHWELEFADLFAERGGFDLVIGNPPWIKLTWNEQDILSEKEPRFAIRSFSANQVMTERTRILQNCSALELYFSEYVSVTAEQNYINATVNYSSLRGLQGNLYEPFLPQAWAYASNNGTFAFIHPESVFNDSNAVNIRRELNPRLRKHFRFSNALKLFADVHTSREFGLNVYSNEQTVGFEQIVNLYEAKTVDECYENNSDEPVYIRSRDGRRNTHGQHDRITILGRDELKLFARILDASDDWKSARLMNLHVQQLVGVLQCFEKQTKKIADFSSRLSTSMLWDETNAQKDGTIKRDVHFGTLQDSILSGAHIGIANPLFNCSNAGCSGNNDNTSIDLKNITDDYLQRVNYSSNCAYSEYLSRVPSTPWGTKYTHEYRVAARKMVDIEGERTLMPALLPPHIGHTNGIIGFAFKNAQEAAMVLGLISSLPYDFFIKVCGKGNLYMSTVGMLPTMDVLNPIIEEITCRAALLNCLTINYADFWQAVFSQEFAAFVWTKKDIRLSVETFSRLCKNWNHNTPLRDSYARRQAMVEIDVLAAMALGMSLEQLLSIYRIQFPILQQHERDTYYDAHGNIVFAKNNALTSVGYSRPEWENGIKGAPAGKKFTRTITDDTMPGGPVERTIEYLAPFDRCDREQDYETAWRFFEEKYGKEEKK